MIRVNLLPIRQERARSAGKFQLLAFAAILVVEIAVFGFLYLSMQDELSGVRADLKETKEAIKELEKDVEETKDYEAREKRLEQKLNVLANIEKKSSGPLGMLTELQTILSPPRNAEERYAQNQKDWNVEWNPANLWIASMSESGGNFELTGNALDADDVAEFLLRLETADHFDNVQLDYVRPGDSKAAGTQVVEFRVTGTLNYAREDANDDESKGS
jgi:Tfp pilus assembly protein PilN